MKTFSFFLLIAAGAGLPVQRSAAQEMMAGEKTRGMSSTPAAAKPVSRAAEILKRFDKNSDGRLDDDEKADAHEVMLQEQMAKEAPPASAQGLGYFAELAVELFDRDHDGRLGDAERADATAFLERGDPAATRETLLRRFDVNRDGKLDDFERRESEAYATEHQGELIREVLLRRFDVNGNGQLEPAEKIAVRAAFMSTPFPLESERPAPPAANPAAPGAARPSEPGARKN